MYLIQKYLHYRDFKLKEGITSFYIGLDFLVILLIFSSVRDLIYNDSLQSITPVSYYDVFQGSQGQFLFELLNILNLNASITPYCISGTILLSILFLIQKKCRILLLLFIFILNSLLIHKFFFLMDGNIWLVQIVIFFGIYLYMDDYHKFAVWGIRCSILLMYFFSGTSKLLTSYWINGKALFVVLKNEIFIQQWITEFLTWHWSWAIGSYTTILIQVLFPILYFTRYKNISIIFMVSFHLLVMLIFPYYMFSICCIILDLILFFESDIKKVKIKTN